MLKKIVLREIKRSFTRYLAIFAIIALGVGFFDGLQVSREAMVDTADTYLREVNLYDFHYLSTLGFDDASLSYIQKQKDVRDAEAFISSDALFDIGAEKDLVFYTSSLPSKINQVRILKGEMPRKATECLIDDCYPHARKMIGKTVSLSAENKETIKELFNVKEFTIVGTCNSPLYMNYERGSSSLGNGTVSGFLYLNKDAFQADYYTDIYVTVGKWKEIYSDAYTDRIDAWTDTAKDQAKDAAALRYQALMDTYTDEIEKSYHTIVDAQVAATGMPSAIIEKMLGDKTHEEVVLDAASREGKTIEKPAEPDTYVLDRDSSIGYVAFDSDSSIVESIAKIFPLFFFLVAALVCMTGMARMIDEERTQIGVLKAIGYNTGSILSTYLFYSGSATLLGSLVGYFAGVRIFPSAIWNAYTIMYEFSPDIHYVLDWKLGVLTGLVAILCTMGATLFSCLADTRQMPATLIRPKAPKPGKRILLEHIEWFWNRLSFLHKVSFRNIFRYKKRFFMMLIGISGCTALVTAGFGIQDSISKVAQYQYDEIALYDYTVTFDHSMEEAERTEFEELVKDNGNGEILFFHQISANVPGAVASNNLKLIAADGTSMRSFMDMHLNGKKVPYPKEGEIVISRQFADVHKIDAGDTLRLETDDRRDIEFKVSGIFENYIYNYGLITPDTYAKAFGKNAPQDMAMVAGSSLKGAELKEAAATIRSHTAVTSVSLTSDFKDRIASMMDSLDAVIVMIVLSAGCLAFIVIYNLTYINITERVREIATIKVLGFYSRETAAYVFRENLGLTGISAVVGLPLGKLLLNFVISSIRVNMLHFPVRLDAMSYLIAVALTFAFAGVVMFVLFFKLRNISMTESLKSVE